jgi:voltage-gated potassium channel Kch
MVQNWAELKFGKRLKKLARNAKARVRARHPEQEDDILAQERKDCIYATLTDGTYSRLAFTVGMFLGACIVLSTVAFILETVPEYERDPTWGTYFFYGEFFFVGVFTIEILLKFWSTRQTALEFFKDFMNVIDVLSILPFYIEMVLILAVGQKVTMLDLRLLRAFRLMRMLKMGRFSGELQLLAEGLIRARVSFALLCGTLILGTVMFSVLMWIVERGDWSSEKQCYARAGEVFFNGCSPFESVPVGFWWAITTMTTVGYGDTFPITPWGKVIGGVAMLAGIFCVALPTGILCTEFSKLYEERANVCKETKVTTELQMRPMAELELFLDSEKLARSRNELDEQLTYLKRLAYIYVEVGNQANHKEEALKLDPMFSTFQSQAVVAMDAMRVFVQTVSEELARIPAHTQHLTRRGSMARSGRSVGESSDGVDVTPRP